MVQVIAGAVVLPLAMLILYTVIGIVVFTMGMGPGDAFMRNMMAGHSAAVGDAAVLVRMNRWLLSPLIIVVLAAATAKIDSAGVGIVLAAATAALVAGYPAWLMTVVLLGAYAAMAVAARALLRRQLPRPAMR